MAYIWFNAVLEALGKRLNYESVSNLYGNAFAKDAAKVVQGANPLLKNGGKQNTGVMGLMGQIKIIDARNKSAEEHKRAERRILGNTDWAEGLM